jgi:rubrerythrin
MSSVLFKTIIQGAIKVEEQSYALYTEFRARANLPSSKTLLSELAQAELNHKEKLLAIMQDRAGVSQLGSPTGRVEDLKVVDFIEDIALSENADFPTVLVYAAKREKKTHEHYRSLATGLFARYYPTAGLLFTRLAEEELIHKNRLEREYNTYARKTD